MTFHLNDNAHFAACESLKTERGAKARLDKVIDYLLSPESMQIRPLTFVMPRGSEFVPVAVLADHNSWMARHIAEAGVYVIKP